MLDTELFTIDYKVQFETVILCSFLSEQKLQVNTFTK